MTRLVVFQTPNDLWCLSCDLSGKILDALPSDLHRYIGESIEEVRLIASSVLKYRIEKIDDNEYPIHFELIHEDDGLVEVTQSGLKMKFAEEYGTWNTKINSLNKHLI